MKTKKIAVVGAGHLGRIHAKLAASIESIEPVVVEPSSDARAFIEKEHGIPTVESLDQIDGVLDGGIVVTPTQTHFSVAADLLDRGCHLLLEKPICADGASATDLCERASQLGRTLQVGHVERFNPAFVAARPLIHQPKYIETTRLTPYSFRATDVSVILDLMIHDIDLVLSMVKSKVLSIQAVGTSVVGPHLAMAKAWLEFNNGTVACLTASRCSYTSQRAMQVMTAEKHLHIDLAGQTVNAVTPVEGLADQLRGITSPEEVQAAKDGMFEKWLPIEAVTVTPQNAILAEQLEFVRCIETGDEPTVTGWDGRDALLIAEQLEAVVKTTQSKMDSVLPERHVLHNVA